MLLTPFASSSRGNLYQVYDGTTRILLECGLPIHKMQELLPVPLADYAACLVTHEHKDHSRSAAVLMVRGMDVYMTNGTAAAVCVQPHPRLHVVSSGHRFTIGTLRIKPFATVHDCAEPCGYLIQSAVTGELMVFATDTACLKYRFPGLTEIALECNYSEEMLAASTLPKVVKERSKRTHMSLETACCWLSAADLINVRRIWLLHLSSSHGSAEDFQCIVEQLTGIETLICAMGV